MAKRPNASEIAEIQRRLGESYRRRQAEEQSPTFVGFAAKWARAQDAGLRVAAHVAAGAVRRKLSRGYTHGQDATGASARAVRVGSPTTSRSKGHRFVRVYAKDFKQIFWEYGWYWTPNRRQMAGTTRRDRRAAAKTSGRFFRVPHWADAARESGPAMAEAFHQAFDENLKR
jgi:hypothetical protein